MRMMGVRSRVVLRGVLSPVVLMAVVPQLGLVEQKEKDQPHQQRGKQLLRADRAFKRFGQQVQESRGQQRAGGQAQHVLCVARQQAKAEQRGQPHTANAGSHRSHQNCNQSHSCQRPSCLGQRPK